MTTKRQLPSSDEAHLDGRYYWTASHEDIDGSRLPEARVCDEDSGVLAWTTAASAEHLTMILLTAQGIVIAKNTGGDLLGLIDLLAELMGGEFS